ncbi:MAG TPA: DNA primase, partial [Streptosporangiaceae bacterium]|nr:DNA primase [Streptosporangiaceae bacterium]
TEGQLAALDEAAPIVAKIKDQGLRTRYAVNLDRWLGLMDEQFVLQRVKEHSPGTTGGRGQRDQSGRKPQARGGPWDDGQPGGAPGAGRGAAGVMVNDPAAGIERELLKLAIQRPAMCGPEFDALGAEAFSVPLHAAVFGLIARAGGAAAAGRPRDWVAKLRAEAPNERAEQVITALAVEPLKVTGEPDARYADMTLAGVAELAVRREISAMKAKMQRMNPVDEKGYNRQWGDLMALEVQHRALMARARGE